MTGDGDPQRVRVVLLDIDGTLLDSNDAHARSWVDALEAHGVEVDFQTVRALIGMGGDKILPMLAGVSAEGDQGQRISAHRLHAFTQKHLRTLRPTQGARLLVQRILSEGLLPVVATSAGAELPALLEQAGIQDLVRMRTTSEDASKSKPDDDIVQAALQKAGVRASEAVMIGDTPYDIEAASRAGVASVSLRCGGWWADADLEGALRIYDNPAHLVKAWASSPLAG